MMIRFLAWLGLARRTECPIRSGDHYRYRCGGLVHPRCGAGWCAEHCSRRCNGKCIPPVEPAVVPEDELAVSDLVRLQRQISDTQNRSVVAILMAGLAAVGVIWIPVFMSQPPRVPTQEIRWTRSSTDGLATCWLAAPTGATVGTLTCCGWGGDSDLKTVPVCGVEAADVKLSPLTEIFVDHDGRLRITGTASAQTIHVPTSAQDFQRLSTGSANLVQYFDAHGSPVADEATRHLAVSPP